MSDEKGYSGWTNYETWAVKLWMDNEQASYNYYGELAQETYDHATADKNFTRLQNASYELAHVLKDEYEQAESEILGDHSVSVWADLLGAALSEVNWHEIAESLLEEVEQETADATDDAEAS